jgi:hypothetical protein
MIEAARAGTEGKVVLLAGDQLLADKTLYDAVTAIIFGPFSDFIRTPE